MWRSVYPCMSLSIACSISVGSDNIAGSMQWIYLGTLRNYNGEGKENVKKNNRFNEQNNNPARASRLFCTLLCCTCTTTTWNDHTLSLLEYGNDKAINSTISVWTQARPPLFESSQNSLLLTNRANWVIAKTSKRMRSLFWSDVFMDVAVVGS